MPVCCNSQNADTAQHCADDAHAGHPLWHWHAYRQTTKSTKYRQDPKSKNRQGSAVKRTIRQLGYEIEKRRQTQGRQPKRKKVVRRPSANCCLEHASDGTENEKQ